ncbi:MAG TPA: non-homologous end-joining DNA ligase [Candidatus Saccharimonadales bacterium]|nr:non-homologous end-joining DNA ligase [Candidatus Saccharimonadales bacterium]
MALKKYQAKRDFAKTPEPKGSAHKASKRLVFVVQEHHASRLHYDFRLELGGVLKSWAVPKGPSMNPHDHHLAVMTEDHPYDYRTFEGVIPKGNYGAGNVIIWDEGWYEPRTPTGNPEAELQKSLKKGHITFILHGQKLKGEFALIKMTHMEDDAWLLVKKGDSFATQADITQQDTSVKSGRRVDDVQGATAMPDVSNYPKKAKPWPVSPMLATLDDEIFDKENWLFEIKWDGYRAIGAKHKGDVQLYSRNGTDFKQHYPPVAEALHNLEHDVILDGEIIVVDPEGVPHFEYLQHWRRDKLGILLYHVFDILWIDGHDIRTMPLADRKKVLQSVVPKDSVIRYSDHVLTKGVALFSEMQRRGLEGVVAKDMASQYREGQRGNDWLKIKTHLRQEVVIGGYTEPRGGRKYLGSLVVGVYDKGDFVYVGHSGGGIPDALRKELLGKLQKLARKTSPFKIEPKPNAPVHWVKPELIAEMTFEEWTKDGSMRQPQFVGMRADKDPRTIKREKPKHQGASRKKEQA